MANPLADDLDHVLVHTETVWPALRNARLFITGGTGFFGAWLLETFAHANHKLNLNAQAWVLTRDPGAFARRLPHLASQACFHFVQGDVRDFQFPGGEFPWVIHAATPSSAPVPPQEMTRIIVDGTRRVLEFAGGHGCHRLLLTSSGAVYGRQLPEVSHVTEESFGESTPNPSRVEPTDLASAYAEGKRIAERLTLEAARKHGYESTIARGFAFVGPYLPLDQHFAIGNFIRDALAGKTIHIKGDGTPRRSYLYAADLATWLWTILIHGRPGRAYNVGSEDDLDIAALARLVSELIGQGLPVEIAGKPVPGRPPERYVPSATRAREELGLKAWIPLPEAIRKTAAYHRARATSGG